MPRHFDGALHVSTFPDMRAELAAWLVRLALYAWRVHRTT
jgi:hypothetical protein